MSSMSMSQSNTQPSHNYRDAVTSSGVGKVRPTGQIRPTSSVDPARDGLSVLTLNPAHVLPRNAPKGRRLFSWLAGFSCTLIVDAKSPRVCSLCFYRYWLNKHLVNFGHIRQVDLFFHLSGPQQVRRGIIRPSRPKKFAVP